MRTLNGIIPRNLAARKARTLLTTLGIALGVAAMIASGVVQESATRSVSDMFEQAAGRAQLAVTNPLANIVGGEGFDAATLDRVRAVDGVEAVAPLLQVTSLPAQQLEDYEYSFISGNFSGAVVYGVDPGASGTMEHYRLKAGQDLDSAGDGAILLNQNYAKALGVSLGDTLELAGPTGQVRFTVAGLLASHGLAQLNRGHVGVTTLATAQRVFGRPERLDQMDVLVAQGNDVDDVEQRLQTELGEGFRVIRPASRGALVDQMLQTVSIGMGFIGLLALGVGCFLIYNTFAMTVAERTRELGLLRALGSGRGQTFRLVLAEAGLLGCVGAAVGVALGLGMAVGMREIAGLAVNAELTRFVVLPEHVILGLAVGVATALVAGVVPALRAGGVSVVDAIQQRRRGDGRVSKQQVVVGLVLAVPSLAATIGHTIRPLDVSLEIFFIVLFALLVGVGMLVPVAIPPLESVAGRALGLFGIEGRLGGRNLARSPGRAALTAGALTLGLASVIVVGAIFSSAKETVLDYMDKTLSADLWLYAPQSLPSSLADAFETLPEVRLARPAAQIPTRFTPPGADEAEVAVVFTAIDPRRSQELDFYFAEDGGQQEEAMARLARGGAVLIASPMREWYGLDVGDTIRLQTLEGPTDFEVAGVTYNTTANGYSATGVYADAVRYFGTDRSDIFAINLVPDADAKAARERILNEWGKAYNIKVETADEFNARAGQLSDDFSALSNTAVLVGVAVAALGVVNTLLMNVLERRREIAMLRSLGMTQGQIVRLVLAESAAMGVLGGVLGVVLGTWLSRFAVTSSASVTGYDFPYFFPLDSVVACVVIALLVPLLAGLWPAWRGARANLVEAMRSE